MQTSQFYVNTKSKVLRKIQGGKLYKATTSSAGLGKLEENLPGKTLLTISYIKDDKIYRLPDYPISTYQSAQKAGVCALTAPKNNFFGPHYDGPERIIEKKISDYRKTCTRITQIAYLENELVEQFYTLLKAAELDNESDSDDEINSDNDMNSDSDLIGAKEYKIDQLVGSNALFVEFAELSKKYSHVDGNGNLIKNSTDKCFAQFLLAYLLKNNEYHPSWPQAIQIFKLVLHQKNLTSLFIRLLQNFLAEPRARVFAYFVEEQQAKGIIDEAKIASMNFNFDIDKAVAERAKKKGVSSIDELAPGNLSTYYEREMQSYILSLQGYKPTGWQPNKGIEPLLEELRSGFCVVEIDPSFIDFSSQTPSLHFNDHFEQGYLIHEVKEKEDSQGSETHIIKIIGAESGNGIDYVYYLDPNDESAPDRPRKIYKIELSLFSRILLNDLGEVACKDNIDTDGNLIPVLFKAVVEEVPPTLAPIKDSGSNEANPHLLPKGQHSYFNGFYSMFRSASKAPDAPGCYSNDNNNNNL
ncbi:hypothetical protein [Legionella jordanis]|uniref:Uncharacterized protein n=1 Tax=Legionella jordanis TaxID=456 RepID=A0A0W0VBE5_9GAMM|nr:hypothetical protein [Legionella jordanis]KTD17425.1 hypothetical protein Ljor_1731 [Legionella jordanis]RMX01811.1 hypothetical protein EAW55_09900 [Legionella jordanis]RMX15475.1 hypothetical protein EAS68_12360 [Legionella jordanis]VEH11553.1 Uncharacterised protein [Legionella jordanis]HAT8714628.1 hypothetical protein [Legionella jordanis]